MSAPRIAAFAGSCRSTSLNRRLLAAAATLAAEAGAEVDVIDLAELPMPIFDEDLEAEGTPESATAFKRRLMDADGILIASPEYNSSYPALVKNVIDWATRPAPGEAMLAAFAGKSCGLLAASPGALGGIRMLPQLRLLLSSIGATVTPAQLGLGHAHQAFGDDGRLKDERARGMLQKVVTQTLELAAR